LPRFAADAEVRSRLGGSEEGIPASSRDPAPGTGPDGQIIYHFVTIPSPPGEATAVFGRCSSPAPSLDPNATRTRRRHRSLRRPTAARLGRGPTGARLGRGPTGARLGRGRAAALIA
jgi:hypothetical protein